jgi:hypothetical protein
MSGNKPKDAPVTREELERALRHSNAMVMSLRDEVLLLGSQLVALTRELERRGQVSEDAVLEALPAVAEETRVADERASGPRIAIGPVGESKYEVQPPDIPCAELLPLCEARCCQLGFPLTPQDLNECEVRWDYLAPYQILHRAHDRFCVHNDPATRRCELYDRRPLPCRVYDCRHDPRVWIDFERREMAPKRVTVDGQAGPDGLDELFRRRDVERRHAMACEEYCLESLRGLRDEE